jgi:hypothetical protein
VIATFPRALAVHTEQNASAAQGATVFSCDFNGWADVPEEEREGIEAFEAALHPPSAPPVPLIIRVSAKPLRARKAA